MTKISLADKQTSRNSGNKQKKQRTCVKNRILEFSSAQKMIHKFLTCDRIITKEVICSKYSQEEFAEKLGISKTELKKLTSASYYRKKVNAKIIFRLISLYCTTKWTN